MVPLQHYHAMSRYNRWMNTKVYDAAERLPDAVRKEDLGAFFGSIHRSLNHILLADRLWLGRFLGDPDPFTPRDRNGNQIPIQSLDQVLYEDFDELREHRRQTDDSIEQWVSRLQEADLQKGLRYSTSSGTEHEHPMWWALSHFFNHQTHHRGQVTTLLTQHGQDVGATDLVVMLRHEG